MTKTEPKKFRVEEHMELTSVTVQLPKWQTDFIKSYYGFLGRPVSLEEFVRASVWGFLSDLRDQVKVLPGYDGASFLEKYPLMHLADKSLEKEEADC